MNAPSHNVGPLHTQLEEEMQLHKCWLWFVLLGVALIVLGVIAIGSPLVMTITSVLLFGCLLLAGGVAQLVNAVMARGWRGFFAHLLAGVLHLVVGVVMIEHPLRAADVLTLMLAIAFLIGGTFRLICVLIERFPGWPWVLLNGIVTLLLGVAVWRQWPESSLWVIGLFVGIDLVFNGWSWVMLGLSVRSFAPRELTPEPSPAP
jgi:uncharacterized membrane protein HdeD (DUF308 family)